MKHTRLLLMSALLGLTACAPTFTYVAPTDLPVAPEGTSGWTVKPGWTTKKYAVSAANPLATDAGYQVIRAGGSAIDAAVAMQMVLTLVEPQSSGIGGGAFLLHSSERGVEAYDGRETAPKAVNPKQFIGADGKPIPFNEAVVGGRAVATPGAVRMLELAHKEHGRLAWAELFQPAIHLAEQGFPVSPRLHALLLADTDMKKDPVAAAYFYQPDGKPWPVGHILKNPELAQVLRQIAERGSVALHEGDIAKAIVDKVQHSANAGTLSLDDLAGYKPIKRAALCYDYTAQAKAYNICGFPAPSSGGITVGQILGILSHTEANKLPLENGLPSAQWLHLYTEASRLAFADRAQYIGDPDFVNAPAGNWNSLLDSNYLAERAKLISPDSLMKEVKPGQPRGKTTSFAPMRDQPEYGTSQISVMDPYGNAVSMTTTIESAFGSRIMVKGFLLNNEMTDFSFEPTNAQGYPVANAIAPGKRPRSSMSPTLVLDKGTGQVVLNTGSPGGAFIIHYVGKALYGSLNWNLTPQQIANMPNFAATGAPTLLEEKMFPSTLIEALKAKGHTVQEVAMTSGLTVIQKTNMNGETVWQSGADPRREGIVKGE